MASPRARHAAAGALALAVAWLAFYAGWLLLAPVDEHARLVFADTAYLVTELLAAKDVVPDFVNNLLRSNIGTSLCLSEDVLM